MKQSFLWFHNLCRGGGKFICSHGLKLMELNFYVCNIFLVLRDAEVTSHTQMGLFSAPDRRDISDGDLMCVLRNRIGSVLPSCDMFEKQLRGQIICTYYAIAYNQLPELRTHFKSPKLL